MDIKVEEYEPDFWDKLVSRGAKYCPSLTGTPRIKVSEELGKEEKRKLIAHERVHHEFRHLLPLWLVSMFALSFVSFSCFFWCFIIGLFLWEGIAVLGEKGWV